jgi:hypothetical protein
MSGFFNNRPAAAITWVSFACSFLFALVQPVSAQFNTAITDRMYEQPWQLHLEVISNLSPGQLAALRSDGGQEIDRTLIYLQTDAEYFQKQVLDTVEQLVAVPEFAQMSREISKSWASTLERVDQHLKLVYHHLDLANDPKVIEANTATGELISALSNQASFERDVLNSLGAGVRQRIKDMATRWWKSSQGLTELSKAIIGEKPEER